MRVVGLAVGLRVGLRVVGLAVGLRVGLRVVGLAVVGLAVGDLVGLAVGLAVVGFAVGTRVGLAVGMRVGLTVPAPAVGLAVPTLAMGLAVGTGVGDFLDLALVARGDLVDLALGTFTAVGPLLVFDAFRVLACAELNKVVARMQLTRVRVVPIFIVSVWVGERDREGGVRPSQKCGSSCCGFRLKSHLMEGRKLFVAKLILLLMLLL